MLLLHPLPGMRLACAGAPSLVLKGRSLLHVTDIEHPPKRWCWQKQGPGPQLWSRLAAWRLLQLQARWQPQLSALRSALLHCWRHLRLQMPGMCLRL